jgi:threonine 3-dehydrogenase
MHAVECEPHNPGDWAVILGAGPIGVLAVQCLEAWGVNVVITDLSDARLEFARKHTGAVVLDIREQDPVKEVMDLTRGRGADFVIEMAASQKALDQAFELVRIRGTVVTISTFNAPVSFNPFFKMTRREIRLQSVMGRNAMTWRRMEGLVNSGKIDLKPYISCVLPIEEFAKGYELVKAHEVMKVLLKP